MKSVEIFRGKLKAGEKVVGGAVSLKDSMATEFITRSMDFVWIDMEHGGLDIATVEKHILAAKKNQKAALVRVPELTLGWIKQVLDCGAHGIVVPQIYTPEEVRLVVSFSRYYPDGKRGYGPRIPYSYGTMGSAKEYIEWANRNIFVCVQIETKEAYESLDEILAIDGYDCVVIGPADLSVNFGHYGDITHPEVFAMIKNIVAKAHAAGKYVGFGMPPVTNIAKQIFDFGVDWIQIGGDYDYIINSSAGIAGELKK